MNHHVYDSCRDVDMLYDQFGREIQVKKKPETREIAVTAIRDRWSTYPSQGLTPMRLADIFKEADAGDVYRQCELFEEMEEKDTHLFSQLQTRKNAVLGLDYDIQPYSESAEDKKISEFCADVLFNMPEFEDALLDMLDALGKGFSLLEIFWDVQGQRAVVSALRWIHGKRAVFYKRGAGVWERSFEVPRVITEAAPFDGEEMPPFKLLYHRYKARSGYDTRAGILRVCAWMYLFKNYSIKDWVAFAETFGMPLRLGRYEPGASAEEKDALVTAVQSLGTDAAGIISRNTEIEFVEAVKNMGTENVYETLSDFCNKEMSKAILGQTASTEGTPGKLGNEDAQDKVRRDLIKADAEALAKTLRAQVIRPLVGYNFGWDKPLPWFKLMYDPPEDLRALSDVYVNLGKMGFPLSAKHVSERFKVPLPEEGEEVLTPAQGAAPLAMKKENPPSPPFSKREGRKSPLTPLFQRGGSGEMVRAKSDSEREVLEAQERVDSLIDRAVKAAPKFFEKFIDQIIGFIYKSSSLEGTRDGMVDLYEKMDSIPLAKHLAQGMLDADSIAAETAAVVAKAEWGPGLPFEDARDFFQARGFTLAGIAKADLLADIKDEIAKAMESGSTLSEFKKTARGIFDSHGYTNLNSWRIETIYRTNMQAAYQAGRRRQMTDPAVLAARPYWRYVAVLDPATRPEHAALHGKVFPADDPFWDTWYPPNGFNCRCTVQTLSESELEREGWKVDTQDPTGSLFEPVDPVTGNRLPARPLLPDPGWGERRGDLGSLLQRKEGQILWRAKKDQPGWKEAGRPREKDIPSNAILPAPGPYPTLRDYLDRGMTKSQGLAQIEADYKKAVGIAPKEFTGVLRDPEGEGIIMDLRGLAHMLRDSEQAREKYIAYLRPTIENPFEIWLTEYQTADGKTKFRKRYIGIYKGAEKKENVIVIGEMGPEMSLLWDAFQVRQGTLDRLRKGRILYGRR